VDSLQARRPTLFAGRRGKYLNSRKRAARPVAPIIRDATGHAVKHGFKQWGASASAV
jgi:hypothetical protein